METLQVRAEAPPRNREQLFESLYEKAFPAVAKFVGKMNGGFDDAKDIFQDALVIYYEKTSRADFCITTSPEAYLLGIAKHLWVRRYRQDLKNVPLDRTEAEISIAHGEWPQVNSHRLLQLLETTGKKCLDLLRAFYYEKQSMREISQAFGYSSEHSATVQKYKCIEKIRDVIHTKPVSYEDFLE
jgi:RNA polymerase sigma factor (sigma-70 family)